MPVLKKGDTVALIAPARAVSPEEMDPFKQWLHKIGLKCKEGNHLYGRYNQFSGTDHDRASDFIDAWSDDTVKAIFCGRGGYGCMRWIDLIPNDLLQKGKPKMLVGFSDLTSLHFHLHKFGYETLHGPMGISFIPHTRDTRKSAEALHDCLFNGNVSYRLRDLDIVNPAPMEGLLTGGNLSLVYASLGTPEKPVTADKILFLEDLDEYYYHFDRMMVSLKRAGLFDGLRGLIIGDMLDMKDNKIPFGKSVREIILEHCEKLGFPIVFGFPAGHSQKNYCLKLNAYTTFDGLNFEQR